MPHDYDFQDDAHLANTALNDAEIDLHLDPVQYYETFEIRIGHFFWMLFVVAIIGFAVGGFLVKRGIL